MPAEIIAIAGGVATVLRPFMPYLVDLGQSVGKKLEDVIAEHGGDTAWELAKSVWGKVQGRFGADPRVKNAAEGAALEPDDKRAEEKLAEVLARKLESDPSAAEELEALLGGQRGVMQAIAGNQGLISNLRQTMEGVVGDMTMKVGDGGKIIGGEQKMSMGG
ncbi:MAG TPA: hypothetical protein VEQ60_26045 [Longimicrobium sp.]|nr:hypothetical protein [Longimicrobium sp.]